MTMTSKITRLPGGESPEATVVGRRIDAESRWLVQGPPDTIADIEAALPDTVRERIGDALVLQFTNAVGQFDLPHLGTLDVHSGKWEDSDFGRMLADITTAMAALPFSAGTGAQLPHDRSVVAREPVLFHMFVYLRHVLSDTAPAEDRLLSSLRQIVNDPHRRFEAIRRTVRLESACRADARTILDIASGRGQLRRARVGCAPDLAHALSGHLPERIDERHVQTTYDVAENRFVLTFLDLVLAVIKQTSELASRSGNAWFRRRVGHDCTTMLRALAPLRHHRIWEEVGQMRRVPVESTVLQRRRGYREVLRHFIRLRLAPRIPWSPPAIRRLLELKNIAELYELWCFFEVQKAITAILGEPHEAEGPTPSETEWKLPWDLRIRWAGEIQLFYNLRFSRSRGVDRQSYSLPLRPDITLEIGSGPSAVLHLFDAKFRLDKIPNPFELADSDENDGQERAAKFKNADLYKMHAYRDAIPQAESVRILYPGDQEVFFEQTLNGVGRDGVGAVPCRPKGTEHLADVVKRILSPAPRGVS
jgi:hypothetical protein